MADTTSDILAKRLVSITQKAAEKLAKQIAAEQKKAKSAPAPKTTVLRKR